MKHKNAVGLLIVTSILWSFGGVIIKSISWNGYAITAFRSLVALIVLTPFVKHPKFPRNIYGILAVVCYIGLICTCVISTKLTTAANAILLQYTAPIYSMLFGCWIMKEPIRKKDILAILFLIGGMILFLYDGLSAGRMVGNLIALLSGVFYGLMGVFMRRDPTDNVAQNIFWGNLIAFFVMLPFIGKPEWTQGNVLLIIVMGVFQLGLPYVLYSKAVKAVTSLEITLITVLEPIMNPIWVFLAEGETPGWYAAFGGAVVLATVLLHERSEKRTEQAASGGSVDGC